MNSNPFSISVTDPLLAPLPKYSLKPTGMSRRALADVAAYTRDSKLVKVAPAVAPPVVAASPSPAAAPLTPVAIMPAAASEPAQPPMVLPARRQRGGRRKPRPRTAVRRSSGALTPGWRFVRNASLAVIALGGAALTGLVNYGVTGPSVETASTENINAATRQAIGSTATLTSAVIPTEQARAAIAPAAAPRVIEPHTPLAVPASFTIPDSRPLPRDMRGQLEMRRNVTCAEMRAAGWVVPFADDVGCRITSVFGSKDEIRDYVPHGGTDWGAPQPGGGAAFRGTDVLSLSSGCAVRGRLGTHMGNFIEVYLPGSYEKINEHSCRPTNTDLSVKILYGHLLEEGRIADGTIVRIGDRIGNLGSSGRSTAPHLDTRVVVGSNYEHPEIVDYSRSIEEQFEAEPARLLPGKTTASAAPVPAA